MSTSVNWTTPAELRAQLTRRWERGDLLRAWMRHEAGVQADAGRTSGFPLTLKFKGPTSGEVTARFAQVREWAVSLSALPHVQITWRAFRHPVMGAQQLPELIEVPSLDAALAWLGRSTDAKRFDHLLGLTQARVPALQPWLAGSPLRALDLAQVWPGLLSVVEWRQRHPTPGCYLRQVDIPGIHSKFIEAHRGVLAELLDLALPADAIVSQYSGVTGFAARYGFKDKPERIRLRVLDPAIAAVPGAFCPDLALDAGSFAALNLGPSLQHVFITENEVNFLAFPLAKRGIVIFGAGYGWQMLAQAEWLRRCQVYYWGDIDTHGFAILDQLRSHLPHVRSFLMDHDTLMAHRALCGEEDSPVSHDLMCLNPQEMAVYDALRDQRVGPRLRLEQERIAFHRVQWALDAIMDGR